jgi:DNA-binding CsgD family transcriptional regulator
MVLSVDRDRRHRVARDLAAALRTYHLGDPPVLGALVPEVRSLLGGEAIVAHCVERIGQGLATAFFHEDGLPVCSSAARGLFDGFLSQGPTRFGAFNPMRPEPRQRNRPLTLADLGEQATSTPVASLYRGVGLADKDQVRVLVCDGSALLCYLGIWRSSPFMGRDKALLRELVEPLRARLILERQLERCLFSEAALSVALEAIPAAALIVDERGRIDFLNSAASVLVARSARAIGEGTLRAIRTGRGKAWAVTGLAAAGVPRRYLLVGHGRSDIRQTRVARAAKRWGLTPRQTQVLALLAKGLSNKTIAADLGCAESTVELHVTAILAKADCESRAAVIGTLFGD